MALDRRHVRATAMLVVMLAMVAAPSTAVAAPDPGVYGLPSQIVIETQAHPGPSDPDRCIGQVFIEFPHIRNAVSYAVTVDDLAFGYDGTRAGPPFPADDLWLAPAHFVAPAGFHRFALNSLSRGDGCAQTILGLEGRWKITASKVSMNERFVSSAREPMDRCAHKGRPLGDPVVLGRNGDHLYLARGVGMVTFRRVGEKQGQLLADGVWLSPGVAWIVETSGHPDRMGAVRIGSIRAGGDAALVGPGMRLRIEAGKPVEVLRKTPGLSLDDRPKIKRQYKIRTNGCVIGARG